MQQNLYMIFCSPCYLCRRKQPLKVRIRRRCMVNSWLACPYCNLSFFDENQYKKHLETEHSGRKIRKAALIQSQSAQFD